MPTSSLSTTKTPFSPKVESVLEGYRTGHFLMADEETEKLGWYSAERHTLMPLDERLHIPKSLKRVLNQERFKLKTSSDIVGVIAGCRNRPSTWISDELADIYFELANVGIIQTFEAWQGDILAGGVLGFHLGGAFIGESMFTAIEDGGKVALVHLCHHLAGRGFTVFDAQLTNPHLSRFGSYEVPLEEYLPLLNKAITMNCSFMLSAD
jgi:leucyl/phenylalanyl-tRNA--protein transferase